MARMSGRIPEAVKRRRNKDIMERLHGERRGVQARLAANPEWGYVVRKYFESCFHSGQFDFYENSDVMTLYMQCELLDRILRGSRIVSVYKTDAEGVALKDEDGNPIPEIDEYGEPMKRTIGNVNGQALKSVLDMGQDLLVTEGARRKLRIDLGMPEEDKNETARSIVERQRASLTKARKTNGSKQEDTKQEASD